MAEEAQQDEPRRSLWHRARARWGRSGLALLVLVAVIGVLCARHAWHERHDLEDIRDILSRSQRFVADKALPTDERLRAKDYGLAFVWVGSLFGAVSAAGLLALAPLWLPGGPVRSRRAAHSPAAPGGVAFLCLIVSVAAAVWIRAPRLDHSYWNDEEYSLSAATPMASGSRERMGHGASTP